MNESMQDGLARDLAVTRRTHGCMPADALISVVSLADAYRLQESVRVEMGAKVVGWKVAAPRSAEVITAPLFDIECMASEALLANTALLREHIVADGIGNGAVVLGWPRSDWHKLELEKLHATLWADNVVVVDKVVSKVLNELARNGNW